MKKITLTLLCIFCITKILQAQNVSIPDANFEAALSSYDSTPTGDGQVALSDIVGITSLNVSNQGCLLYTSDAADD